MITFSIPITVANNINTLRRAEIVSLIDNWKDATPNAAVCVQFYGGAGMKKYGNPVWLVAKDSGESIVASASPASQEFGDMIVLTQAARPGAYTAVMTAFNAGAKKTTPQRCLATEAAVMQHLMGAEFAGT